jgi:diguanylate cyclase (GGDEF)-like protein
VWIADSPPLTDPAALRFRIATLKAGIWLGVAMTAAGLVYFGLTWDDGNRPLLMSIGAALAVVNLGGALLLPGERIVRGRWREAFFLAWTLLTVATLLLLGAIDPTEPSPLMLPLLMPMLFAGMSYPRASARISCAAVVFGYIAVAILLGHELAFTWFFAMVLIWTAGMCLWQAENRERQRDELERISVTDPLTGALNRRGFEDRLQRELAEAARHGRPLTLAVLDLDDFKAVNDRNGHAAGDLVLREAVERLRGVLRPLDSIGRIGGDEFAVVCSAIGGGAGPASIAGRLRAALAGHVPASIGHSSFPTDGASADELFRRADMRLYAAKANRSAPGTRLSAETAPPSSLRRSVGV